MSRTFHYSPNSKICSGSDKKHKQLSNRKLRCSIKQQIKNEKEILSLKREVSNIYTFPSDGHGFVDFRDINSWFEKINHKGKTYFRKRPTILNFELIETT